MYGQENVCAQRRERIPARRRARHWRVRKGARVVGACVCVIESHAGGNGRGRWSEGSVPTKGDRAQESPVPDENGDAQDTLEEQQEQTRRGVGFYGPGAHNAQPEKRE